MWWREHWKSIALGALHALSLAFLTLVWMNLSWEFGDEVIVARINQIARYEVVNPTNKVVEQFKKDLLLVNTSYDKTLIDYEDDYGIGNKPVTDRKKLADFFRVVNQSGQRPSLVVIDIIFDNPSPDDSLLTKELRKIDNLVISSQLGKDGKPVMPWPGLNFALAQYETTTGTFLKYNLINDTVHYLPAAMYHETQGTRFREWAGVARSDPGWWINSFIVDLPVRKAHIDNGEVLIWNLGDALSFPPEDVTAMVANKIIIVGDIYEYDIHQTLLGQQPGPLIVANAYLGMLQGIPRIKLLDGFLIFLLYFISTMYVLQWRRHKERLMILPGRLKVGKFALKYFTYILIFSLYSIFLYLLTSRHFQLLIFGLYFNLFEYLVDRYRPKVAEETLRPEVSNVD
ncbi:MAG TPA: hypothetical protein VK508_17805 [Cyclobacteriaceae bacterium]|nr:hypothetical protein [Cyclobacteriaceae bacterium]